MQHREPKIIQMGLSLSVPWLGHKMSTTKMLLQYFFLNYTSPPLPQSDSFQDTVVGQALNWLKVH